MAISNDLNPKVEIMIPTPDGNGLVAVYPKKQKSLKEVVSNTLDKLTKKAEKPSFNSYKIFQDELIRVYGLPVANLAVKEADQVKFYENKERNAVLTKPDYEAIKSSADLINSKKDCLNAMLNHIFLYYQIDKIAWQELDYDDDEEQKSLESSMLDTACDIENAMLAKESAKHEIPIVKPKADSHLDYVAKTNSAGRSGSISLVENSMNRNVEEFDPNRLRKYLNKLPLIKPLSQKTIADIIEAAENYVNKRRSIKDAQLMRKIIFELSDLDCEFLPLDVLDKIHNKNILDSLKKKRNIYDLTKEEYRALASIAEDYLEMRKKFSIPI